MSQDIPKLQKYSIYLKMTVFGESPNDAYDTADHALDVSGLLYEDGVVAIEIVDEPDEVELSDDDELHNVE